MTGIPPHDLALVGALADGFRPTDSGNADRLIAGVGERVRYVHEWRKWLVYDEGRWHLDWGDALVTELARRVVQQMFRRAVEHDPAHRDPMLKWASQSERAPALRAMTALAHGVPGVLINHAGLDADPYLLNVLNGTVDLRNGRLRDHDPDDLLTMQAPVIFDPTAEAPLWEACLDTWQPDPEVRCYLQRFTGSAATGQPVEHLFVNHGGGGNGKSRFFGAVGNVLGPYVVRPHQSLFMAQRFDEHQTVVASLFRARCLIRAETQEGALNETLVKNLTGGDRLRARRIREDEWEFDPTWTAFLHTNHRPRVPSTNEAIWRRLRLIPWEVTIPRGDRDEGLAEKLGREASGILNWIVAGARDWLAGNGTEPARVVAATEAYRTEEDVLGLFLADRCVLGRDKRVAVTAIGEAFTEWCRQNGRDPWTATLLGLRLGERGLESYRSNRVRYWRGLGLLAEPTLDLSGDGP